MWSDLALIAFGGFFAALLIGSAGFAFAIVATGVWIHVLPPAVLVLLVSVCATLLHAANVWQFRREIEYELLWPFLIGGLLGVPFGVIALQHVNPSAFRHLFGAFMIAYSAYMLVRPQLPVMRFTPVGARIADGAVGWVSGFLGGIGGLQGVLTTIWCGLRGWDKRRSRCVYQPYSGFTAILVTIMTGVNVRVDTPRFALYVLVCLPALAAGLWMGLRVFNWISEERFRRLVLWLILASGISLQF